MTKEKKLIYLMDQCCDSLDDFWLLADWIDALGLEDVYEIIHYMFDEDERIK